MRSHLLPLIEKTTFKEWAGEADNAAEEAFYFKVNQQKKRPS